MRWQESAAFEPNTSRYASNSTISNTSKRDETPLAARDAEIAAQQLLKMAEAQQPGSGIDAIEIRDLLPRAAELALQQRHLDVRLIAAPSPARAVGPASVCRGNT